MYLSMNYLHNITTISKADLISILVDEPHTPSDIRDADLDTDVLIDVHALIQALGKSHGCQTFVDLANSSKLQMQGQREEIKPRFQETMKKRR